MLRTARTRSSVTGLPAVRRHDQFHIAHAAYLQSYRVTKVHYYGGDFVMYTVRGIHCWKLGII